MIRKRRRKKKLDLDQQRRSQLAILIVGATAAAILAASIPMSCNTPLTPLLDNDLEQRLEDMAREAEARGRR